MICANMSMLIEQKIFYEEKIMKEKVQNRITIAGYLKENNLEERTDKNGQAVIRGSLTVAFDATDSIRINVYVSQYTNSGKENKAYASLCAMLPQNTMSIKNLLESDGSATFETVKNAATKVVAYCEFSERAWINSQTGKEQSTVQISLCRYFDSIHKPTDESKFDIGASFVVDMYIESMRPEMGKNADGEMEETGRYIVVGLTPDFRKMMHRIEYVTEAGAVSEYVADNWRVGESVYATGMYHNLRKVVEKPDAQAGFGQPTGNNTTTTFVEERLIRGGSQHSIDANDGLETAGFTTEDAQKGLQLRAEAIQKNAESYAARSGAETTAAATPAAAPKATKDFGFGNDMGSGFGSTTNTAASAGFDPSKF